MRKQSEEQKEKARQRSKKWRAENREKHRAYSKGWKKKNPEKAKTNAKKYQQKAWHETGVKKKYEKEWRAKNKDTILQQQEKRRKANPEREASYRLKNKYGITLEDREQMLLEQGDACAICGAFDPGSKVGWHVDHCHKTDKLRGVLCHHCNCMLGYARDNPATLLSAIKYLRKHSDGNWC